MTDENVDLNFLAEQGKRILAELAEVRAEQAAMREGMKETRAEQHALASLLGKVSDAVTAIAATQDHHGRVLERHSEILGKLHNTRPELQNSIFLSKGFQCHSFGKHLTIYCKSF